MEWHCTQSTPTSDRGDAMGVGRPPVWEGRPQGSPRRHRSVAVTWAVAAVATAAAAVVVVAAAAAEAAAVAASPPSSPKSSAAAPVGSSKWTWERIEHSDPASRYTYPPSSFRRPVVDSGSDTMATHRGLYVLHPASGWWRWTPRGSVCDSGGGDWARLPTNNTGGGVSPPRVLGARVAVDAAGGRMWVFGGKVVDEDRPTAAFYEYDEGSGRWTWLGGVAEAEQTGPRPGSMVSRRNSDVSGLAFYHDPAADALFVAEAVRATTPGISPFGEPGDGRDVRVWRYDLSTRTWSVEVAYASAAAGGGPPPVHYFWGDLSAFSAGGHLYLVRDAPRNVSLWRYIAGSATQGKDGGGGWTQVVATNAVEVDKIRYATWTAGRYWLAYLPGPIGRAGVGSVRGVRDVPGLTWRERDWVLSDTDRFVAWDAAAVALVGAERRGVAGERLVAAGPRAVPGLRRKPRTGGTLVAGAPGCGNQLVGYLLGGDFKKAGPPVLRDDLWRVTFDAGGLEGVFAADRAANASATPSPSPTPTSTLSPTPTPSRMPVPASPSPSTRPGGPRGGLYDPCGGRSHPRAPRCSPGLVCTRLHDWYSQCRAAPVATGQLRPWAQCGGRGWARASPGEAAARCSGGYVCTRLSAWYSHCAPARHGGGGRGGLPLYAQCAGGGGGGPWAPCAPGGVCVVPGGAGGGRYGSCQPAPAVAGAVPMWGQCGGEGRPAGACTPGSRCVVVDRYYAQCWPVA